MVEVKYKKGLYTDIGDKKVGIRKLYGRYIVHVLDKATNKVYTKEYLKLECVNNFFNKYGVQIIF